MFGKDKENEMEVPRPNKSGRITISFDMDVEIAKSLVGVGDEEEQGRFMEKAITKAIIDKKLRELEVLQDRAKRLV